MGDTWILNTQDDRFDKIIWDQLDSDTDEWQSTFSYSQVIKAMKIAYELALEDNS